jgi:predicted DNA-binding protein
MPNVRAKDKECLSVWLPSGLYQRLKRMAKSRKIPMTKLVEELIYHETKNIELSPEDYREIARRIEARSKRVGAK